MERNQINPGIDAIEALTSLAENKIPIYLALPYKGVALPQKLTILEIQNGQVTIQAPNPGGNCLVGDFIFLHSQGITQTLAANSPKSISPPAG